MGQNLYAGRPAMAPLPDLMTDETEARTDGGIGAHGRAARAGSHPGPDGMLSAMHSVAMGITGEQGPLQFRRAVDAVQAQVGNRAFMNQVARQYGQRTHRGAGGPAQAMPRPDNENLPLQMMWRNPGRRVLPGLMNRPALNRRRASRVQPPLRRELSTSPRRRDWNRDILFGAASAATLELAIKLEAATDSSMPRPFFKQLGRAVPHGFPVSNLWDKPAFDFADREQITRRDLPYMAYAREAIATAMARGGNIYWALGRLHFDNVFF